MATVSDVNNRYNYIITAEDGVSAPADKMAAKLGAVEDQAKATGYAAKQMGSDVASAATNLDRASAPADKTTASLSALTEQAKETGAAMADAGVQISQSQTVFDRFAGRNDQVTQAATRLAAAQRDLQGAIVSGQRALAAGDTDQATYDRTISSLVDKVNRLAAALGSAQAAADLNAVSISKNSATAAGGSKSIDAMTASTIAQAKGMSLAAAAAQSGKKGVDDLSGSVGQSATTFRQLEIQAVQAISGIATGQPVFMTLVQQGHQVYDVMQATGTSLSQVGNAVKSGLGAAFAAITSPVGLAVTAVTALVGGAIALGAASESSARQLSALQNSLRPAHDNYVALAAAANDAAKAIAATTGISTSDARSAAQTIASSQYFDGTSQQLQSLIKTASDLAAVMGEDIPAAAKEVTAALADPGAEAQKLADGGFKAFNQELIDNIKNQQASGDRAGAFATVMGTLSQAVGGANDNLTPLQQATKKLDESFTKTGQDGRSLADALGSTITSAATLAVEAITKVINSIESLREAVAQANAAAAATATATPQGAALHPTATGRPVLVNPASGAVGMFQVLPSTAAALGYDPYDPDQNILAGLTTLHQFGGNSQAAIARYGGYGTDIGAASTYISKVQNANVANLAPDVASQIEYWGQILGLSPDEIALGQRMAIVESGGRQYSASASSTALPIGSVTGTTQFGPPIPPGLGGSGVVDTSLNDANKLADSLGLNGVSQSQLLANIQLLQKALSQLDPAQDAAQFDKLTEALQREQKAFVDATPEAQKLSQQLATQTNNSDALAAAYLQGYGAVAKVTAATQAQTAADQVYAKGTQANVVLAAELTDEYLRQAQAQGKVQAGQQTAANYDQIKYIQAETDSLGMNNDARDVMLAHLQAEIQLKKENVDPESQLGQAYLQSVDDLTKLSDAYNEHKQALSDLSSAFSQSFDTIGNSITQALVGGQGAAVNWRNVMTSAAQQVLQQFLKLAVLNPLLNSLFGQNNTTLESTVSALGSLGASGGGGTLTDSSGNQYTLSQAGGGSGSLLNIGGNVLSVGKSLYGAFENPLGISGGAAHTGIGVLDSTLNYPLIGSSIADTVGPGQAAFLTDAGVNTAGLAPGAFTIGSATTLLGAAGAGYGLGSLAGGFLQSSLNKTGPGPQIGAGAGALIGGGAGVAAGLAGGATLGAALGSVVPVIGTIIGAIAGGLLGGAIGPRPPSLYSSAPATISGGNLAVGNLLSQADPNATAEYQQTVTDAATLNQYLDAAGLKLTSLGALTQFGDNTPGGYLDPSKYGDVSSAFSQFKFTATDQTTTLGHILDQQLSGQTFGSLTDLQNAVSEITTFVNTTVPSLKALGATSAGIGSFQTALANLHAQFDPAIAEAQKLGYAEQDLTTARDKAIQALNDQVAAQVAADQQSIQSSYLSAVASVTGDPQDAETAALYNFDQQAQQQRDQLQATYQAIWGDAYTSASQYIDLSAQLEQSLGEQRLAIQTQYDQQITAAAQAAADAAAQALAQTQQNWANLTITDQGYNVAYTSAAATIDGSPQAAEFAALYAFDIQAQQQTDAFSAQLIATFGDAYATTQSYADQMALLEKSLGEQRLAIQAQYNTQITSSAQQSVTGLLTSITQFVTSLQTGSSSPLSPLDQYNLVKQQFANDNVAAQAGDFTAAQNLTNDASALLTASRAIYGSGAGYVTDYNRVLDVLKSVVDMGADALTNAAMNAISQQQTNALLTPLNSLVSLMTSLQSTLRQAALKPAWAA